MNISRQIGWSQESNLLYQILKQLNKLTSIMFGLKPKYKVFTALLTQSGGDNTQYWYSGELIIGVTYRINDPGGDFTNVGAPNNNPGTYFVATGTIPNYSDATELQYNTGAPTAIVLENTIGNIWFTYASPGVYNCNSANLFTLNKTTIDIDNVGLDGNSSTLIFTNTNISEELFTIFTDKTGVSDDILIKNRLEIKVYN